MNITDVLRSKGDHVQVLNPDDTVAQLVQTLADHRIGALVVTQDDAIVGIVSERDVVRSLSELGVEVLQYPVRDIMTANVFTCTPDATLEDLMDVMTERRFRHVPVVEGGLMIGIVSIGDVVKRRVDELATERDHLSTYLTG